MFEISVNPQKYTEKTNDKSVVLSLANSSKDKKLRECVKKCNEGALELVIRKKFIDARKGNLKLIYRFDFLTREQIKEEEKINVNLAFPYMNQIKNINKRPVVIGFGPAGMFAALVLAQYGLKPIVIERGKTVEERIKDIESFKSGKSAINPDSNIQFGEGGAGTFSDGKLYTGVTSGLKAYIGKVFMENGADEDIVYDSHPHIGTDALINVVKGIRQQIISLGGEVLFETTFTGFLADSGIKAIEVKDKNGTRTIDCSEVILAIGHSSRDTIRALNELGLNMEPKPFSVGVRIEHRREMIDKSQYGIDTSTCGIISAANYKLAVDTNTGKKLYTFCMCPGGEVIAAQSSSESVCTNGMSYHARDLENSNAALLVPITPDDYGNCVLDGIKFQEEIEYKAYIEADSTGKAPYVRYGDLINGKTSTGFGNVTPSFMPGVVPGNLYNIFPEFVVDTIKDGVKLMGKKIKGFDDPDSILTAPEARSSSPVRILRDSENKQSTNIKGLYPCGEGAGYAGGIMSSAIDGINCANALINSLI